MKNNVREPENCIEKKAHLPPKNRVGGFSEISYSCTRSNWSETQYSRPENEPTPTTIASGVPYYGYRYYNPEMGRWINRDPIREAGSRLNRKDFSVEERKIELVISLIKRVNPHLAEKYRYWAMQKVMVNDPKFAYLFVKNNPASNYDYLGLACGSGITDGIVPDKPGGNDFTACCEAHDSCYGKCNANKTSCDDAFHDCMTDYCMNNNPSWGCFKLSDSYFGAVSSFGQGPFDDAQKCCKP